MLAWPIFILHEGKHLISNSLIFVGRKWPLHIISNYQPSYFHFNHLSSAASNGDKVVATGEMITPCINRWHYPKPGINRFELISYILLIHHSPSHFVEKVTHDSERKE